MPGWGVSAEPWAVALGRELADVFDVEGWQVFDGTIRFRGHLLVDPESAMYLLTQRVEALGFAPMLHTPHEISFVRLPAAARGT
ncbi:MAG: conserved rane protein of unknown function, partial [candidate division NC10 bacterium]|nr:conserved rane protein of unknown function [candidate division NC10 bacterium]